MDLITYMDLFRTLLVSGLTIYTGASCLKLSIRSQTKQHRGKIYAVSRVSRSRMNYIIVTVFMFFFSGKENKTTTRFMLCVSSLVLLGILYTFGAILANKLNRTEDNQQIRSAEDDPASFETITVGNIIFDVVITVSGVVPFFLYRNKKKSIGLHSQHWQTLN